MHPLDSFCKWREKLITTNNLKVRCYEKKKKKKKKIKMKIE